MREFKLIQHYDKHVLYRIDDKRKIDFFNIEVVGDHMTKDEMFYVKIVEFEEFNTSLILT